MGGARSNNRQGCYGLRSQFAQSNNGIVVWRSIDKYVATFLGASFTRNNRIKGEKYSSLYGRSHGGWYFDIHFRLTNLLVDE